MKVSKQLKSRLFMTLLALLAATASLVTATFAWYIYQTGAHTTNIKMAVGSGAKLQISNSKDGDFRSATEMKAFTGTLNPVSTNRITGGFQRAERFKFEEGTGDRKFPLLKMFEAGREDADYYKTTLYIRANGKERGVYLADISYEDREEDKPISTALRIGLVVYEPGFYGEATDADRDRVKEFIFELNPDPNTGYEQYNTFYGVEGHVLDCDKTDGSTVQFDNLLTEDNYCIYDSESGLVSLKADSRELFKVKSPTDSDLREYCDPIQVDVYVWLEGCDKDCTMSLLGATLENLALSFACEND